TTGGGKSLISHWCPGCSVRSAVPEAPPEPPTSPGACGCHSPSYAEPARSRTFPKRTSPNRKSTPRERGDLDRASMVVLGSRPLRLWDHLACETGNAGYPHAVDDHYVPRLVDELITDLLTEFPALSLVGPRASGKTTTVAGHAGSVIGLDQPREAAVVEADPDAALRDRAEPVLIDEWQLVPSVLGAVKRAVDTTDELPGPAVHPRCRSARWTA